MLFLSCSVSAKFRVCEEISSRLAMSAVAFSILSKARDSSWILKHKVKGQNQSEGKRKTREGELGRGDPTRL